MLDHIEKILEKTLIADMYKLKYKYTVSNGNSDEIIDAYIKDIFDKSKEVLKKIIIKEGRGIDRHIKRFFQLRQSSRQAGMFASNRHKKELDKKISFWNINIIDKIRSVIVKSSMCYKDLKLKNAPKKNTQGSDTKLSASAMLIVNNILKHVCKTALDSVKYIETTDDEQEINPDLGRITQIEKDIIKSVEKDKNRPVGVDSALFQNFVKLIVGKEKDSDEKDLDFQINFNKLFASTKKKYGFVNNAMTGKRDLKKVRKQLSKHFESNARIICSPAVAADAQGSFGSCSNGLDKDNKGTINEPLSLTIEGVNGFLFNLNIVSKRKGKLHVVVTIDYTLIIPMSDSKLINIHDVFTLDIRDKAVCDLSAKNVMSGLIDNICLDKNPFLSQMETGLFSRALIKKLIGDFGIEMFTLLFKNHIDIGNDDPQCVILGNGDRPSHVKVVMIALFANYFDENEGDEGEYLSFHNIKNDLHLIWGSSASYHWITIKDGDGDGAGAGKAKTVGGTRKNVKIRGGKGKSKTRKNKKNSK